MTAFSKRDPMIAPPICATMYDSALWAPERKNIQLFCIEGTINKKAIHKMSDRNADNDKSNAMTTGTSTTATTATYTQSFMRLTTNTANVMAGFKCAPMHSKKKYRYDVFF